MVIYINANKKIEKLKRTGIMEKVTKNDKMIGKYTTIEERNNLRKTPP